MTWRRRCDAASGTWVTGLPPSAEPGVLLYVMVESVAQTLERIANAGGATVTPLTAQGEGRHSQPSATLRETSSASASNRKALTTPGTTAEASLGGLRAHGCRPAITEHREDHRSGREGEDEYESPREYSTVSVPSDIDERIRVPIGRTSTHKGVGEPGTRKHEPGQRDLQSQSVTRVGRRTSRPEEQPVSGSGRRSS